jgi:S1-C subfamily serine protease
MHSMILRKMFGGLAVAGLLATPLLVTAAPPAKNADKPAYLGIGAEPTAKEAGSAGVTLREVSPESPAEKAGLKSGDRIVAAGDRTINNIEDLKNALANYKPGDKLVFKAVRGNAEQDFTVVLGQMPEHKDVALPPAVQPRVYLGIHTRPLTAELRTHLQLDTDKGAVVAQVLPESPAAEAGLAVDDVVTHVGAVAVANPEELRNAIRELGAGKAVTLKVVRGKKEMELQARLREAPPFVTYSEGTPELPEGFKEFQGHLMPFVSGMEKVSGLEKKIQELEKRVHELEQKLAK